MSIRDVRWDSAGKLAAGILLAVAIVVSIPSLLGSEQPKTLPPDVGVPQAAIPPPVPAAPAQPAPQPHRKQKRRRKPKQERKPKPNRKRKPNEHGGESNDGDPAPASSPAPPIVAAVVPAAPTGSRQEFGFERP